jgi:hypothetical protein
MVQLRRGLVGTQSRPGIDRGIDTLAVDAKAQGQRLEERDARPDGQFAVKRKDFARERHPGRFTPSRQQFLAQFDQACRLCRRVTAPVARAIDQRAAALRNRLQQFAEERGIHRLTAQNVYGAFWLFRMPKFRALLDNL